MPRILVTGATGYVGGRLVPELLAAGHDVRCLARTPAKLEGRSWRAAVEVMAGDVEDGASLARGRTLSNRIDQDPRVRGARAQTRTARSKVKGATTSVGRAAEAQVEAAGSAARKAG